MTTMTPTRTAGHAFTLCWRSAMKLKHSPEQLLEITLQPVVLVAIFVFLFGGAISGSWHDYLPYVLPGIMAQTIVLSSMGTGVGLNSDIRNGVFDRLRAMPIARSAPLLGTIIFDVLRYLVAGLVVLAFGMLLGFRVHGGPLGAIAAFSLMIAFAFALCWAWVLLGLVVASPTTLQAVGFVVMLPLTFGSNLLVATNTLPGWLQAWVTINPVTYLSDAVRGLLVGGAVRVPATGLLIWVVALTGVFAPLAVRAYRRRA